MTTKPDLTRVWASGAPGANIEDPDVTVPGKFDAGWVAEIPPFENFNFLQQLFTQGLAHNNEEGINVWDTNTTYPIDGLAKGSDGVIYRALVSQDGNDPIGDAVNWTTAFNSTNSDFYTVGGAVNAYTFTEIGNNQPPKGYTVGMRVRGIINITSTGAATGNVAGLGIKNIKTKDGNNPQAGDLTATELVELRYDGVNLIIEQTGNQIFIGTIQSRTVNTPPIFKDNAGREMGQLSKAWVNFIGTGVVSIQDSFNVSSITDLGLGKYQTNFTNAMPNVNYCALASGTTIDSDAVGANGNIISVHTFALGSVQHRCARPGDASDPEQLADQAIVCVTIFDN